MRCYPYFPVGPTIPPATPTDIMVSELVARMVNYLDACVYMADRGKLHDLPLLTARLTEFVHQHVEWKPPMYRKDGR